MANHHLLLILLVSASAATSLASVTPSSSPYSTVYELLEKYSFPRGILPEGVQDYALQRDGSFEVSLPGGCEINVGGFTLRYEGNMHGNIQSMLINELTGVSVKVAIKWVSINAVERHGDQLIFNAIVISKSFPVNKFSASPRCNRVPEIAK
ncbi:uncharacterized protein LOC123451176 [Hordeum vulgare subsp. vulgare]|uniref:Uncharacterized protein n=1 Tax=Hordeum vulgare subsp. vulgare TaxID=112509 RepID=A0A8I6XXG9_HORVV|nr:uncharacterized protein LOC123451176 [Hordeum vulgare subsp. vulgare]